MTNSENQTAMRKIALFGACAMAPIVIALIVWAIISYLRAHQDAKFSQIEFSKSPMTSDAVQQLVGPPTRIDHAESTGITGDAYYYRVSGGRIIKVTLVNSTVFKTELVSKP